MSQDKLEKGLALHQTGKLAEAEAIYRDVLNVEPTNPDALHLLGLIFQQHSNFEQAIGHIKKAITGAPERPTFHFNLGVTYGAIGELAYAAEAYQMASQLKPDWLEAYVNLGTVLGRLQNYAAASNALKMALALDPNNGEALIGLTAVLEGQGHSAEAEEIGRRAVSISLKSPEAWTNLGNALNSQGKLPGKLKGAEEAFRHALAIDPDYVTALYNLGNVLNDQWRKSQALRCFREAIEHDSTYLNAWQNLLMNLLYDPTETEQTIFTAHKKWATQFANADTLKISTRDRGEDQRLRIGYVSPDFKNHSCASFLRPLFAEHDRVAYEIYAYANVARADETTAWFQGQVDQWCDVTRMRDGEMADRIRQDGIDILVDLAGFSAGNRLLVFALKPAPIQLSWLGYPGTTGLPQMDYRLTDEIADPQGGADENHSEQLIRLDGGFHCYAPFEAPPEIGPLPFQKNGFITFGSFNHIAKITPAVIRTWAEILKAVPDSKLLLKGGMLDYDAVQDRIKAAFWDLGITRDRVELKGWIARDDNPLTLYNSVDICLDTFPYNGTTTSFEALSMGIPVITLRGARHASRVGASILTEIGHSGWIAETASDYKALAVDLAGDISQLENCRNSLRKTLENSSFGDAVGFTARIEATYQELYAKASK
jgi:protein O-GlcNAc transferase